MSLLRDILFGVEVLHIKGAVESEVQNVAFDSRLVQKNGLFVAIKGGVADGHQYITEVVEKGVTTVVCSEGYTTELPDHVTVVKVADTRKALAQIASNFYHHPSKDMDLIGVTGTNGKTTTATLLFDLFTALGYQCGLISTVKVMIGEDEIPATHTTPDPLSLNQLLDQMRSANCAYVFMEVSSHAVEQYRVHGLHFRLGMFSNLSQDHLDYHGTMEAYAEAKRGFFNALSSKSIALSNGDDEWGAFMLEKTKAKKRTYALQLPADFNAKVLEKSVMGMNLNLDGHDFYTQLVGDFNAYNLLGVYSVARLLNKDELKVLTAMSTLTPVRGRFELVVGNGIQAIVDYAHTPDALLNVLKTIGDLRTGNEKVITVVGCGGNRDKGKRPLMAEVACEWSDKVIFTSDNPRNEKPEAIIEEMVGGLSPHFYMKYSKVTDRREAIKNAVAMAQKGDIILVAGKGHETYQEINGERTHFDDREEIQNLFKILN